MLETPTRAAVAEFIGAFALTFIGAGSIVAANATHDPSLIGVAIAHGVTIAIMASALFFLVWAVFATAIDPRGTFKAIAGFAIGLTITVDILFGGPFTGAAMNPSRAFGPQLVGDHWSHAWVWYAGPLLGGAVAAVMYSWLYLGPRSEIVGTAEPA
jgi:aquaporin TIP